MAVEARHLNLFPQQILPNREMMSHMEPHVNLYFTQMGYSLPLSGTTTETMLPACNSTIVYSVPPKTAVKEADSGLTYNLPVQRKRSRDSITPYLSFQSNAPVSQKQCSSFSFLGEDVSLHMQQQQLDVDRLVAQHMEKMRMDIEEKRKRQARRILEAVEFGVMKKLKAKEEEIEKTAKLNWALQEKVKSLFIENQLWRDLAQTTEATANALRTNLEQVLTQVRDSPSNGEMPVATAAFADDAESRCGSNDFACHGEERELEMRMLANKVDDEGTSRSSTRRFISNSNGHIGCNGSNINSNGRLCRNCGKEESSVLILPCRHLCLCTVCGSTQHTCPICKTFKNASVNVNFS